MATATLPQPTSIVPYRAINGNVPNSTTGQVFSIIADAVIEEEHQDDLVITDHPVEAASYISDHAYNMPSMLTLVYVWASGSKQNSSQDANFLAAIYQQLLSTQAARTLLTVYTGKRQYSNMIIQSLSVLTNRDNENILSVRITLREVLIATTQTFQLGANINNIQNITYPQQNAPVVPQGQSNLLAAPNFNPTGLTLP